MRDNAELVAELKKKKKKMKPETRHASQLYLDLLKKCLTRVLFPDGATPEIGDPDGKGARVMDWDKRSEGRDWPAEAETMIGLRRLDNLEGCIVSVLENEVPGDLIETGVWRGGASIFMRAVLKAYGVSDRTVWLCDSFAGLPRPDTDLFPKDAGDTLHEFRYLAVSQAEVERNFTRYGLLDGQVRFLRGWFKDTLPRAPIKQIAVLRLDGDMYESTIEALTHLYDKVSQGGFVIIDDGALAGCRAAVQDFRRDRCITERLHRIDWTGIYWRKGDPEREQDAPFDEQEYVRANPDVAEAIRQNQFRSGYEHYLLFGRNEGRWGH